MEQEGEAMSEKKVVGFTRDNPDCPKCGGLTKRYYHKHEEFDDFGTVMGWAKAGEYLVVYCLSCHYEFLQQVKP